MIRLFHQSPSQPPLVVLLLLSLPRSHFEASLRFVTHPTPTLTPLLVAMEDQGEGADASATNISTVLEAHSGTEESKSAPSAGLADTSMGAEKQDEESNANTEEAAIVIEQPLSTIKEVFVYRVPPLRASSGHRAEEWGLANPVFTGEMRFATRS